MPNFRPHSKAKAIYKSKNQRNIGNSCILSDVATAYVHSEKTRLIIIIIIIVTEIFFTSS